MPPTGYRRQIIFRTDDGTSSSKELAAGPLNDPIHEAYRGVTLT